SVSIVRKSISLSSSPDSASVLKRSRREFGSSASSTMIWDTSTWSRKPCNLSTTRSGQGCHPCFRYVPLPICPGRTAQSRAPQQDSNLRPLLPNQKPLTPPVAPQCDCYLCRNSSDAACSKPNCVMHPCRGPGQCLRISGVIDDARRE